MNQEINAQVEKSKIHNESIISQTRLVEADDNLVYGTSGVKLNHYFAPFETLCRACIRRVFLDINEAKDVLNAIDQIENISNYLNEKPGIFSEEYLKEISKILAHKFIRQFSLAYCCYYIGKAKEADEAMTWNMLKIFDRARPLSEESPKRSLHHFYAAFTALIYFKNTIGKEKNPQLMPVLASLFKGINQIVAEKATAHTELSKFEQAVCQHLNSYFQKGSSGLPEAISYDFNTQNLYDTVRELLGQIS